jgi:hypothetical protein
MNNHKKGRPEIFSGRPFLWSNFIVTQNLPTDDQRLLPPPPLEAPPPL